MTMSLNLRLAETVATEMSSELKERRVSDPCAGRNIAREGVSAVMRGFGDRELPK